ncbi:MAG TPA: hypothetical protein VMF61_06770 [Candidatus Acidoferrales bacterium]|nr:hypothetical protein [Candidatus Acidoferrales bacterium]
MKVKRSEIDELLARHGIAPLAAEGSDSRHAAAGGVLATVEIAPDADGTPLIHVVIDSVRAGGRCPLDKAHALSIVRSFQTRHLLPRDPSFQHLFANLLLKLAELYLGADLETLLAERIRLHPTSYHIDRVVAHRGAALHLHSRLAPDAHDKHAVFAHRHGDSLEFPG